MTTNPQTDARARVAAALREHGMVHLDDQVPADEYDCCADAVLAALLGPIPPDADVPSWTAIRAIQLMNEAGAERDAAEATIQRVRLLHDRLAAETELASPDDPITRGDAAQRIATALDTRAASGSGRVADETQAERGPAPSACDAESGEPCPKHEREAAHAEGEHCFCGPECEAGPRQPFDAEVRTLAQLAEADPEYRALLVSRGRESSEEPWFGMPGCTCKPWTVEDGQPRYLEPHETVDKVSGWARRADCPHHQPDVVSRPGGEA